VSTSKQQTLQQYSQPNAVASINDATSPLVFKDWIKAYTNIIPGQEFAQYNQYLLNWYKNKNNSLETTGDKQLQIDYLTLVKELQVFAPSADTESWYNSVDINNEKELLLAIPYFAKKLKEIALYYLQLRERVKQTPLRYNIAGTDSGLTLLIEKAILENYTQKPKTSITLPSTIWSNVPQLTAIKDSINVQIEELYDTHNYFDRSSTQPASTYFDVSGSSLTAFISTLGLDTTDVNWVYNLGNFDITSDNEVASLFSNLSLAEKYLNSDFYTSNIPVSSLMQDTFNVVISTGSNFFYWPNSPFREKAYSYDQYAPEPLSGLNVRTLGTAGSSIDTADTIFVKTNRGIDGAWLYNNKYINTTANISAIFYGKTKTALKYPFASYGLSAEDIPWTGPGFAYDPRYLYLDDNFKQSIQKAYWSLTNPLTTTIDRININDTTLINYGAQASISLLSADRVYVSYTPGDYTSTNFSGNLESAWLYRFNKTDISISPSITGNLIYWPFERLETTSISAIPGYYPDDISSVCLPLPISAINIPFGISGPSLTASDVIYKLTNFNDDVTTATECCWLSGATFNNPATNIAFINSGNFQGLFQSGRYTNFVWTGPNNTEVNKVFSTAPHQPDCKFVNTPNTTYKDHNLCTCHQVLYSPFGHPGQNYTDSNSFTDFIVQDFSNIGVFDIQTWIDQEESSPVANLLTYSTNLQNSAWNKTNGIIVTPNQSDPFGGTNAFLITDPGNSVSNQWYMYQTIPGTNIIGNTYTLSVYASSASTNLGPGFGKIWLAANGEPWTAFDLQTGTIIGDRANGSNTTNVKTISALGNGWYRCSITFTKTNNLNNCFIGLWDGVNNTPFYSADGHTVTIYGPQVNPGSNIGSYLPTTSTPAVDSFTPLNYTSGGNFAWYQTNNKLGWGDGKWVTNSFNTNYTMYLKTGRSYIYYRAKDINTVDVLPDLVVRNNSGYQSNGTWVHAYKDINGNWTQDSNPSTMLIYPGNYLYYSRQPYNTYYRAVTGYGPLTVFENHGSIWSSYDYLTIGSYDISVNAPITVTVAYPTNIYTSITTLTSGPQGNQYPTNYNNILLFKQWILTSPDGSKQIFYNTPTFNFTPNLTGFYTIQLSAISGTPAGTTSTGSFYYTPATSGGYIFTNIPAITALSGVTVTTTYSSYKTPVAGFTLNTPLFGWDYSTQNNSTTIDVANTNLGAKPYWGKIYHTSNDYSVLDGVDFWGTPKQLVDEYNVITQPKISDITLSNGVYFEYERVSNNTFKWIQPVNINIEIDQIYWATIYFNTTATSLLDIQLGAINDSIIVIPTTTPSDIILKNYIDNLPVEIHYYAKSNFNWPITVTPLPYTVTYNSLSTNLAKQAANPWANLANNFYPSVAFLPTVEDLYSAKDLGGYFLPQNLGALTYTDKDYTVLESISSSALSGNFNSSNYKVGGRGFSKQDQATPYTISYENSSWLKETVLAGSIAGNVNDEVFKKYQKFIPYQSLYETNPRVKLGIVTPDSLQSPWGGPDSTTWIDKNNYPVSFTGELNISKWSESQVLKQNGLIVDNWCTDIFGNQYGLYKDYTNPATLYSYESFAGSFNYNGVCLPISDTALRVLYNSVSTTIGNAFTSAASAVYTNTAGYGLSSGSGTIVYDMAYAGNIVSVLMPDGTSFATTFSNTVTAGTSYYTLLTANTFNVRGPSDPTEISTYERKNLYGQIWTRQNNQIVNPASVSLTGVFNSYAGINLASELIGNGIKSMDVFFDTIMVVTSGTVIFEKLVYDYSTDTITSFADNSRYISLAMPVVTNLNREFAKTNLTNYKFAKPGETWFKPEQKLVTISVCGLSGNKITPELYQYDVNKITLRKIFPVVNDDLATIATLSSLNIVSIDAPVLSNNGHTKQYVLGITCKNNISQDIVLELIIDDRVKATLNTVNVYSSPTLSAVNIDPPVITQSLTVPVDSNIGVTSFSTQLSTNNRTDTFNLINSYSYPWLTLSADGTVAGTPPSYGNFLIPFTVTNNIGSIYYTLNVNNISPVNYTFYQNYVNTQSLDPRISFTRASSATYFDPTGTIQTVNVNQPRFDYDPSTVISRTNLLTYSEQLDNAAWNTTSSTVTPNATIDPTGNTNADLIVSNLNINLGHNIYQAVTVNTTGSNTYTYSTFLKYNGNNAQLTVNVAPNTWYGAQFNLQTGTINLNIGSGTSSISSVGNGWYRCSITVTATITPANCFIELVNASFNNSFVGTGTGGVYAWGAQLESGSNTTAYISTIDSATTVYDQNATPRGLLIEESRTNLLLYSSDFNRWNTYNAVVSSNMIIAPDGTNTGAKLIRLTSTDPNSYVVQQTTGTVNNLCTFSVYAKAAEYNQITLLFGGANNNLGSTFDVSGTGSIIADAPGFASTITKAGNGWFRCTTTGTVTASEVAPLFLLPQNTGTMGVAGIFIWGAQFEKNSFASSYIPTTNTQVTRAADYACLSGSNFNSIVNLNQGTFYVNFQAGYNLPAKYVDPSTDVLNPFSPWGGTNYPTNYNPLLSATVPFSYAPCVLGFNSTYTNTSIIQLYNDPLTIISGSGAGSTDYCRYNTRKNLFSYTANIGNIYAPFTGSPWWGYVPSLTANDATYAAPDGTYTATRAISNVYSNLIGTFVNLQAYKTYTFSIYAKSNKYATEQLGVGFQNLSTKFTITSAWNRYSFTFVADPNNNIIGGNWDKIKNTISCQMRLLSDGGFPRPIIGIDLDVSIWGPQLELGSVATSYVLNAGLPVSRYDTLSAPVSLSATLANTFNKFSLIYTPTQRTIIGQGNTLTTNYAPLSSNIPITILSIGSQIGADNSSSTNYLNGYIKEIGYYNYALPNAYLEYLTK
jgi:hypothetical protein